MLLKLDLHVHTSRSQDASTDPQAVAEIVRSRGLDGVAVTEHDLFMPLESDRILVIPGIEVSSKEGHILGLGGTMPVPRGLDVKRTIELLHEHGFLVVIPHPYDRSSPGLDPLRLGSNMDAIETINSSMIPFYSCKKKAENAARTLGLPMVAGSDSHIPSTIGDAYTLVDVVSPTVEGVLESIRSGKTTPCGSPTNLRNRVRTLRATLAKSLST